MFSGVLSGKPIDVSRAKGAGSRIADKIAEDGLSSWLEAVRRHHEGTYQHCLSGYGNSDRLWLESRSCGTGY